MPMTMRNKLSEKPTLEPSPLQLPRVHCTLHGMEGSPLQMPIVQWGDGGVAGGAAAAG